MSDSRLPSESNAVRIARDGLEAVIRARGAEMVSLRLDGEDLMWPGDDTVWTGRSPLLFPVVGKLKDDTLRLGSRRYPLGQHGFVRARDFAVSEVTDTSCRFRFSDDARTREAYPFAFALEAEYTLAEGGITVSVTVENPGPETLPASFGFHPALRWPLEPHRAKTDYVMLFDADRALETTRPNVQGLLRRERETLTLPEGRLDLDEDLFAEGALVFPAWESRVLTYAPRAGGRGLRIAFENLPHGALWMRPGADYLCVEPWHGHADPEDFDGDFTQKPGLFALAPGESRRFRLTLTPVET